MKTTSPISPVHSGSVSFLKMARGGGRGETRRASVDALPRGAGCHLGERENCMVSHREHIHYSHAEEKQTMVGQIRTLPKRKEESREGT